MVRQIFSSTVFNAQHSIVFLIMTMMTFLIYCHASAIVFHIQAASLILISVSNVGISVPIALRWQ